MEPHLSIWSDLINVPVRHGHVTANGVRTRVMEAGDTPVTFFVALDQGALVARPGMTYAPSRTHDPGGGVAGFGGIEGPLIGTRPPAG